MQIVLSVIVVVCTALEIKILDQNWIERLVLVTRMQTTKLFQMNSLSELDVPGAKLPNPCIERNTNVSLKRWLACRGIAHNVNKDLLVKR